MCDHLKLVFVKSVRSESRFFFFFSFLARGCPFVPVLFVEKIVFTILYCLCFFVKDQLTIFMGCISFFLFVGPMARGRSWARDETHTAAVTRATAMTTPDP